MGVVPIADEKFVGIEAEFLAEEFGELRITGEGLVGRSPFVVGEVIAPAIIDGDLDE